VRAVLAAVVLLRELPDEPVDLALEAPVPREGEEGQQVLRQHEEDQQAEDALAAALLEREEGEDRVGGVGEQAECRDAPGDHGAEQPLEVAQVLPAEARHPDEGQGRESEQDAEEAELEHLRRQ